MFQYIFNIYTLLVTVFPFHFLMVLCTNSNQQLLKQITKRYCSFSFFFRPSCFLPPYFLFVLHLFSSMLVFLLCVGRLRSCVAMERPDCSLKGACRGCWFSKLTRWKRRWCTKFAWSTLGISYADSLKLLCVILKSVGHTWTPFLRMRDWFCILSFLEDRNVLIIRGLTETCWLHVAIMLYIRLKT